MTQDCINLKNASLFIRKWIERQKSVKEESLTDWLLYEISEKISGITYHAFTRNEEAETTGADWEWWFIFDRFAYKFRVQAKKIKPYKDNYSSIAYANKYGLQIEKLIEDSNICNSIPIYAFYTSVVDRVRCGNHITDEGVYITGANGLFEKIIISGKRKIDHNDILEETIPLSCMLCCHLVRYDKGSGYDDFILNYFQTEQNTSKKELNEGNKITGRYEKIPRYVESLIELSKEKIPDWWEDEFHNNTQSLNGILIVDRRNRKEDKE